MGKKSEMDQLSLGLQTQAAGERLFEEIHALPRLEMAMPKSDPTEEALAPMVRTSRTSEKT